MSNMINDTNTVEYAVILEGVTVYKSVNRLVAENFKNNLPLDERNKANIIPVTQTGQQVLLG